MHDVQMMIQVERNGAPFGYVVIDSIINGTSSGGVRIYPDMALDEARMLAREMTLKFSFIGLSRGGAKSGIRVPVEAGGEEKLSICEDFGRKIRPLIEKGIYYPGMDMNCGPDELRAIYRGAGIRLGKLTDTSFFTAVSVANALMASREHLRAERPLTLAIEGFGSVAAYLAERLPEDLFRIVSVSTIRGAVRNPIGFSCKELLRLRATYGDDFVNHVPSAEKVDREAVLSADVDILVPAARVLTINADTMERVMARCIVPVANAPYANVAVDFLHSRGILCLPGFVTNSGGVFASGLFDSGVPVAEIQRIAADHYRPVVAALLRKSERLEVSPVHLAEEIAILRQKRQSPEQKQVTFGEKILRKLTERGVLPKNASAKRTADRFVRNLGKLLTELGE